MPALAANQATARAGGYVMSESVQPSHVVLVKAMEDSLKVPLFMRSSDGTLVQVPSDRVGTDVSGLQSSELFAGGGERNIDHVA